MFLVVPLALISIFTLSICKFFIIVLLSLSPILPKIPYVVTDVGSSDGKDIFAFAIVCPAPLNTPLKDCVRFPIGVHSCPFRSISAINSKYVPS